jgi:hypothetical protein
MCYLGSALNSVSKYKACCLPILIDDCRAYGFPPVLMGFALSAALRSVAASVSKTADWCVDLYGITGHGRQAALHSPEEWLFV